MAKLGLILKIIGGVLVIGAVTYSLLVDEQSQTIYWILLVAGIVLELVGRFVGSVSNDVNHDE